MRLVDRIVGHDGFALSGARVGWLAFPAEPPRSIVARADGGGAIETPNGATSSSGGNVAGLLLKRWSKHNGQSAKERAMAQRRMGVLRSRDGSVALAAQQERHQIRSDQSCLSVCLNGDSPHSADCCAPSATEAQHAPEPDGDRVRVLGWLDDVRVGEPLRTQLLDAGLSLAHVMLVREQYLARKSDPSAPPLRRRSSYVAALLCDAVGIERARRTRSTA